VDQAYPQMAKYEELQNPDRIYIRVLKP
jgi:hypothetical protein